MAPSAEKAAAGWALVRAYLTVSAYVSQVQDSLEAATVPGGLNQLQARGGLEAATAGAAQLRERCICKEEMARTPPSGGGLPRICCRRARQSPAGEGDAGLRTQAGHGGREPGCAHCERALCQLDPIDNPALAVGIWLCKERQGSGD